MPLEWETGIHWLCLFLTGIAGTAMGAADTAIPLVDGVRKRARMIRNDKAHNCMSELVGGPSAVLPFRLNPPDVPVLLQTASPLFPFIKADVGNGSPIFHAQPIRFYTGNIAGIIALNLLVDLLPPEYKCSGSITDICADGC